MKRDYEPYEGYYTVPFSQEPFEGQVIKIDGKALNVLFQHYWTGDEYSFRDWLERFDDWFVDKPYKVYSRWLQIIVNKLQAKKEARTGQGQKHDAE